MWEEGAPHPVDWRPTKLSQEDLDQAHGEPHDPSAKAEDSSEEKPEGTSLVLGIPAGCESDIGSNLDELDIELEAPLDQFSDLEDEDEEEAEDWFIQARKFLPVRENCPGQIRTD